LDTLMADDGQAFFSYRVQTPDGGEAIRSGAAAVPPTFGQLADYAANQGERFLAPVEMSPAPPPAAEPPPGAAAPSPAPTVPPAPTLTSSGPVMLPTDVAQTSGAAPTNANPPRPLYTQVLPALGTAGAVALASTLGPAAAGPAFLLSLPAAGAGAALGEGAQASLEGPQPPGAPSTGARMWQAAKQGMEAQTLAGGVGLTLPYWPVVGPVIRAAKSASSTLTAGAEDALTAGRALAASAADKLSGSLATASKAIGDAGPGVTVNVAPLRSMVAPAREALDQAGATAGHLALFDQSVAPIMSADAIPLPQALDVERHLNNWVDAVGQRSTAPGVAAPVQGLAGATTGVLDQAAAGTGIEALRASYRAQAQALAPARQALQTAATAQTPATFARVLGADGHAGLEAATLATASDAERAQLGQAWLASTRAGARATADPVAHVASSYEAMPAHVQEMLFGAPDVAKTAQQPIPALVRAASVDVPSMTRTPSTLWGSTQRLLTLPRTLGARAALMSPGGAAVTARLPMMGAAVADPFAYPIAVAENQTRRVPLP
jgi:hypothetical protein